MTATITINGIFFDVEVSREQLMAILDVRLPEFEPATPEPEPEPEPDREPAYYSFGDSYTLTHISHPIMIGYGVAPDDMEGKCLWVGDGWEFELFEHNGYQIIKIR